MILFKGKKLSPKKIAWILFRGKKIFGDIPDVPDIPDIPSVKKLATPVIRLETDGTVTPPVVEGQTPAILGIAILGRTILGVTSVLPKLAAPVIRLLSGEESEIKKLEAPVIRIEETSGEEPEIPVITKLGTPVIRLDNIEDDEDEPDVPDVPDIKKLGTPVIQLEVESENVPEEDSPPVLSIEGSVISWTKPTGATAYYVYSDKIINPDGSPYQDRYFVAGKSLSDWTSCDVLEFFEKFSVTTSGKYTFYVKAKISNSEFTDFSNGVTYDFVGEAVSKLDAPSIKLEVVEDDTEEEETFDFAATLDGDVLTWYEAPEDGQNIFYNVCTTKIIQGTPTTVNGVDYYSINADYEKSLNLKDALSGKEPGIYPIYVLAMSFGGKKPLISNEVIYEHTLKLSAPTIRIETAEEPEEPEEPEIEKLDAPVIELVEEDKEPLVATLEGDYLSWNQQEGSGYWLVTSDTQKGSLILSVSGVEYGTIGIAENNPCFLPEDIEKDTPLGEIEIYIFDFVTGKLSNPVIYDLKYFQLKAPEIFLSNHDLDAPSYVFFTAETKLIWDTVEGAEYYGISYKKANDTGSNPWNYAGGVVHPTHEYELAEVIETLEPGRYIFAVYAVNNTEDKLGDWAETAYVKE